MREPRLVIFDCDGVLVDSEVISNEVLARALTEEGLETTLAEARRAYQGLLLEEVLERAEASLGRPLPDGWLARYEGEREAEFRARLKPIEGAAEAVEQVRAAGAQVCVASQGKLSKTRTSLALSGLAGLFAEGSLFSAEMVSRGKPHPDLFLHAARTLGVAPRDCAVVEDTASGILAALAAGMRALGLAADSDESALRAAGAEIVMRMSEVPARLGLRGPEVSSPLPRRAAG